MTSPEPGPAQEEQLATFAARVRASPHNLVSRRAREELGSRHVPEAVALARSLPPGPRRLLDVGSGGGLPGVVIAVVRPDLEVHLLEATAKKVGFLRETVAELALDVPVHHGRAEELGRGELRGAYDLVTARAVAPLASLVRLTLPFLGRGGRLYAVKGEQWPRELAEAGPALERAGGRLVATPGAPAGAGDGPPEARRPRTVVIERSR